MGIGPDVSLDILHLIAGEGDPVVKVADFSQLEGMIAEIKSSACSSKFKRIFFTVSKMYRVPDVVI